MKKTTAALFLFGTIPFVGTGCSSGVQVGGENGVAYRGRLFSDGKIIAMETSSGGDETDEDEFADEVTDEVASDDIVDEETEVDGDVTADEEVEEQAQADLDE